MLHNFTLTSGLFFHYARLLCETVIPFQEAVLNDRVEGVAPSHAIDNFRNAAALRKTGQKTENGGFFGMVFQDSDLAKWLEAAAYSLVIRPDPALEARINDLVELIGQAQEDDGYLDTYFTLERPDKKFTNLCEAHELYCAGHMMEAAVGLWEATGNEKLLSIMRRNADCLYRHFITEGAEGYPGHPEVELALMRLWRATGEDRYRELAEHFVNVRGVDSDFFLKEAEKRDWYVWGKGASDKKYNQCHLPVREQKEAVGHSVRAVYLYTAMADIAAVTREPALLDACHALFDNITKRRMYITGGIGSTVYGEAFTTDFDLPNDTVYAETCASIGLVFFASRMLSVERDGRFADVMERAIYNTILAGIELDGTKFFYVNPLEVIPGVSGQIPTHGHVLPQRPGWFGCACCPPNAARLLTSIAKYAWEEADGVVYANLYTAGILSLPGVKLTVETAYPFGDTVSIRVTEGQTTLALHIPAFSAQRYSVMKNGADARGTVRTGYYYVEAAAGDTLVLTLDMTPKLNRAHPLVARDSGMAAVTVGPVVYCAEGADNQGAFFGFRLNNDPAALRLTTVSPLSLGGFETGAGMTKAVSDLGSVYVVEAQGVTLSTTHDDELYFTDGYAESPASLRLIPYFMWGNRGVNPMRVWLPLR